MSVRLKKEREREKKKKNYITVSGTMMKSSCLTQTKKLSSFGQTKIYNFYNF